MPTQMRCERPEDHRPHSPYVRPDDDQDYACPGGPPDALTAVGLAEQGVTAARRQLDDAVRRARRERHSYAAIATVLGVSRQAVWERFHTLDEQAAS